MARDEDGLSGRRQLTEQVIPTVLAAGTPSMKAAVDETFGPVAPVLRFSHGEEAVEMANATDSGLAAYLYSRDLGRVWRMGEALEFGVIGIKTGLVSYEAAPFGGIKQSGLGREGSRHGLDDYLEIKYLCIDGLNAPAHPFPQPRRSTLIQLHFNS